MTTPSQHFFLAFQRRAATARHRALPPEGDAHTSHLKEVKKRTGNGASVCVYGLRNNAVQPKNVLHIDRTTETFRFWENATAAITGHVAELPSEHASKKGAFGKRM